MDSGYLATPFNFQLSTWLMDAPKFTGNLYYYSIFSRTMGVLINDRTSDQILTEGGSILDIAEGLDGKPIFITERLPKSKANLGTFSKNVILRPQHWASVPFSTSQPITVSYNNRGVKSDIQILTSPSGKPCPPLLGRRPNPPQKNAGTEQVW